MVSYAAALLDGLMGRNRNNDPTQKQRDLNWADGEVCKFHLCEFCPNELFTNTKADLGTCTKIHDDALRDSYKASSRYLRMGYEEDFLIFLESLAGDVDRRIKRGHERLLNNSNHLNEQKKVIVEAQQKRIDSLTEEINQLTQKVEEQGCEGMVEEAKATMIICDQKIEERKILEEAKTNPHGANAPKEMEVCPICGAFLVVGDAPQRVEEHLQGKQHIGYDRVRKGIEAVRKRLRGEDPERDARLKKEREEREIIKMRERGDGREKRRDRGADDRTARQKSRSSSRSRHSRLDGRSKRSRSRDRRSHDRKERKRSGERRDRDASSDRKRSRRDDLERRSKDCHGSRDGRRPRRDNGEVKDVQRENGHDRK